MIRTPEQLQSDLVLRTEVVVVGTGPGGGALAARLAEAGMKVVLLEAGKRFLPQQLKHTMAWSHENLFQEGGTRVAQGSAFIPVFSAEVVGGGTFVNSAICFRAPDERIHEWRRDFGLDITPESLAPLFAEVERDISVAKSFSGQTRGNARVFRQGIEALGWTGGDYISRNAPGCTGCGVCRMGCPVGGKGSTDTNYLPRATAQGARIYAEARVEKIRVENGRAVGVEGSFGPHRMRVTADHVVLAGGAFGTPMMLMKSGLGGASGQVGKNLRLHPSTGTFSIFPDEVRFWDGVTQGYYLQDTPNRILLETFSETPEIPFTAFPRGSLTPRQYRHVAAAGGLTRDISGGTVDASGNVKYELADADRLTLLETLRRIARIFFAAGASEVFPGVFGSRPVGTLNEALAALPDDLPVTSMSVQSAHPHGTARMSADPKTGVVNPHGRVYGTENLWVSDGSLFPTALGVNPQLTIMAFAKQVADRLLAS